MNRKWLMTTLATGVVGILALGNGCYSYTPAPEGQTGTTFTERKLTQVREGDDRSYLQGGRDIHEASLDLQRRVREVYLSAAHDDDAFRVVDCSAPDGSMAAPEAIFSKIEAEIAPLLK